MKTLYLVPAPLAETDFSAVFPAFNLQIISELQCFVVENTRTARRFIKQVNPAAEIDKIQFFELNEHTSAEDLGAVRQWLKSGEDVGMLSEAGCPSVADPGSVLVEMSAQFNYQTVPLVGPSSVLLSLMASGFNGQNFAFAGYLPVKEQERVKAIRKLENRAYTENQTQIFIETPYRNVRLLADLLQHCNPQTRLCIAADLTAKNQFVATRKIGEWKKNIPDLNKKICIFLIYK